MASLRKRGEYKVRDSVDGPPAGRNVIRASVQLLDDNCHVLDMPVRTARSKKVFSVGKVSFKKSL